MKLISRADLARLAGVSNGAITRVCKTHLSAACQDDLIDATHPLVQAYIAKADLKRGPRSDRGTGKVGGSAAKSVARPTTKRKAGRKSRYAPTEGRPEAPAPKLDEFGFCAAIQDLTAKEISERYGSNRNYVVWLDAYQKQQRARDLYIKNDESEGRLVARELVQVHIFGMIDALFRKLVTDVPTTLAAQLYGLAKAGSSLEQGKALAKEILAKQLLPAKVRAARVLRRG